MMMLLFSGKYSGIVQLGEHDLELEKDFSKFNVVSDTLDSLDAPTQIANHAHTRLVDSGCFTYRRFVKLIDEAIEHKMNELRMILRPPLNSPAVPGIEIETAALADVRDPPIRGSYHPPVFSYKQLSWNHQQLKEISALHGIQIGALCASVFELHGTKKRHAAEIGRLNGVIAALEGNAIEGRSLFHPASAAHQNRQCIAGACLEEMGCDSAPPHLDAARSAFRACSPALYPPQPHQVRTYSDFIAFEAGSPRGRQDIP